MISTQRKSNEGISFFLTNENKEESKKSEFSIKQKKKKRKIGVFLLCKMST